MITRFFNTSKPIHLVIISVFTLIIFVIARVNQIDDELSMSLIIKELGKYSVVLISIFTLNFLVRKNKLTNNNNYDILFYSLLLMVLPMTMEGYKILLANFFLLLALRRIISLRSNINIKKKLFDAAFWIAIATLFYFWAILFFALIIAALLLYSIAHFKNWIIPFVGVLVVVIITIGYSMLFDDNFGGLSNYLDTVSFNFSDYNTQTLILAVTVISVLSVWALIFYILNLKRKQKVYRSAYMLIVIAFLIGATIIFIAPHKNGSEYLFMFSAIAIIMANYLESVKNPWLAELYVWLLILAPVTLLML